MCTCVRAHMNTYMHTCTHTRVLTHRCARIHAHTYTHKHAYTHMYINTYTCTHIHIHMLTYIYIHILHTQMHIYMSHTNDGRNPLTRYMYIKPR